MNGRGGVRPRDLGESHPRFVRRSATTDDLSSRSWSMSFIHVSFKKIEDSPYGASSRPEWMVTSSEESSIPRRAWVSPAVR
ncbi:MAG: hypothetical protein JWN86_1318 [Planctomycetota bacterium]|nr:hypothetical protein [Planctomycetota bacterium]